MDRGHVVTKQLPGADKPEIAAFGAVFVPADNKADAHGLRRGLHEGRNTGDDHVRGQGQAARHRGRVPQGPVRFAYLVQYVPEFRRYIEDFPRAKLEGAEDLFYWMKDKFGPKPTVALYHATIWRDSRDPTRAVASFKQFYASHYFQAGLELMALVDAPGRKGFYLLDLFRARVDPPTGMLSGVLLGKIRGGVEQGVAEGLRRAKSRAEGK